MNIYKRQMEKLGLNLDQYSEILGIPKSITKKIVNGNGEVTENMEINKFLRKNMFDKHQEVEKNKEESTLEATALKIANKENQHPKVTKLLEKYPESKELWWYLNDFNKEEYFDKYKVKNKIDLMKRYNFSCNSGKLKYQKSVGTNTIDRVVNKQYDEMGIETAYPLICQLYDCFELGNIGDIQETKKEKKVKNPKPFIKNNVSQELLDWYKAFDFRKFLNENNIKLIDLSKKLDIPRGSMNNFVDKKSTPPEKRLVKAKEFVSKFETKTITGSAKIFDIPVNTEHLKELEDNLNTYVAINHEESTITPLYNDNEEILRNILINRLTEEEKTLIRLFGGRIDN